MAFVQDQMTEVSPKIVQATFGRGLPSLCRGWRTPDPSPVRSGLPKCTAPGEYVLEDECLDIECSTPRAQTVSAPRGRSMVKAAEKSNEEASWARLQTPSPRPEMRMPPCVLNLSMFLPSAKGPPGTWTSSIPSTKVQEAQEGCSVSLGSVGHPDSCAAACKYAFKSRGCKDGASCSRCHLCKWTKSTDKNRDAQAQAMPVPPSGAAAAFKERNGQQ